MDQLDGQVDNDQAMALLGQSDRIIGEPTLGDAMAVIAADMSLQAAKRRHWVTSMNRIAAGIGLPPASLPVRLTALRHHVGRLNAARMGIDAKTLSNHKSNLRTAVLHFAKTREVPTRGARLSPEWGRPMAAIRDVKPRRLLSGLMRYCSVRSITPESVTEKVVDAYFEFRAATSFLETGVARRRELIRAWNKCVGNIPDWPERRLSVPDLPRSSPGPDWADFSPVLQQDIEDYLRQLKQTHRSANGKRRQPCKAVTIMTRRRELVAFARKAVASRVPIEKLSSLAALLDPETVRLVLDAYWGGNEQPKTYVIDLAWKLLSVARSIGMCKEAIAELDDLWHSLEEHRGGKLTESSLKVIRAVLTTDIWSRVCRLPHILMEEAERLHNRSPKKAAARAALAIQILILTRAPVRVGNLLAIRLGHNLVRPGGDRKPFLLQYPGYDVKNRVDLAFPLSVDATALIDRYIRTFRPHLTDHRSDWLFPGEGNKPRSAREASAAIARRLEKETGLRIIAHKFRHAAAAIILRENPGNFEFVRRVLGHRNIQTTISYYTALESFQASEAFGQLIEERLAKDSEDEEEYRPSSSQPEARRMAPSR